MSMIARALVAGLLMVAGSGTSFAEQRGAELAPVATWAGKSTQLGLLADRRVGLQDVAQRVARPTMVGF